MAAYRLRNYAFLASWKEDNMATNYNRPNLPYKAESLPNSNRYALLAAKKQPPTAVAVDGDINYIVDSLNDLDTKITDVEAGVLVGANNPQNAGLFVTTDGNAEAPTILWKKVDATNVVPGSLTTACLADGAVTNDELGVGCVETENRSPNCVTSPTIKPNAILPEHINPEAVTTPAIKDKAIVTAKIDDRAVDTTKMSSGNAAAQTVLNADGAGNASFGPLGARTVGTAQLVTASVTNPIIAPLAVDATKITSNGAATGTVLTSGAGSEAIWSAIPTTGQVLQIVSYTYSKRTDTTGAANMSSFAVPFALTITPLSSNSRIFIYLGTNLASAASSGGYMTMALYKNGTQMLFDNNGILFSGYQPPSMYNDLVCFSRLIVDLNTSLNGLTYELKGADASGYGVILNQSSGVGAITSSSIYAVEVQI